MERCGSFFDFCAGCHVLPLKGWYDVGQKSKASFVLKNAKLGVVPGAGVRENVEFIMTKKMERSLQFEMKPG